MTDKTALTVSSLSTPSGKLRGWIIFSLFWLATAGQVIALVAGGKILDQYLRANMLNYKFTAEPVGNPDLAQPWLWWIIGGVAILLAFLGQWGQIYLETSSQVSEENQIRRRLLMTVFQRGPGRLESKNTGHTVALATQSAEKLTLYLQGFLPRVKGSFSAPIIILVLMSVFVHPLASATLAVSLPLIPLSVLGFRKLFRKSSGKSSKVRFRLAGAYLDALSNLTTLQLLGASERVGKELEKMGEENRQATMRVLRSNQLVILVLDTVFSLFSVTSTALVLLSLSASGVVTVGQVFTGMGMALLMLEPIDHFGSFFYVAMAGRAAKRDILSFLRLDQQGDTLTDSTTVSDSSDSLKDTVTPPDRDATSTSAVQIQDMSFRYQSHTNSGSDPASNDSFVLRGVNQQIHVGQRVAIVGPSGGGKTTLLRLIKGFLNPTEGRVKVGGKYDDLLPQTALVSQNTWLFTGSIRDNLIMGAQRETSQISEEELWTVLAQAHLDTEIRAMPYGLDTRLAENGIGLSSGQKQRLSLARALLSDRKILLLDEATSQVDLFSEREILAALADLGREYTLIMVTHRHAMTQLADRVLKVSGGMVNSE